MIPGPKSPLANGSSPVRGVSVKVSVSAHAVVPTNAFSTFCESFMWRWRFLLGKNEWASRQNMI